MAYIDFYRGTNKYRVNMGECNIDVSQFFDVSNQNYITASVRIITITAQGSSLPIIFNVNNLNWTSPPDVKAGKSGYLFKNIDDTLEIFIYKRQDNNINWKGVVAVNPPIETTYATNEPTISFALYIGNRNTLLIEKDFINVENVPASQPPTMNTGLNPFNNEVQLMRARHVYNGQQMNFYTFGNPLTYNPYLVFRGSAVYTTGNNSRTTPSGTIMKKGGVFLRQPYKPVSSHAKYGNNEWTNDITREISGMGKTVTSNVSIFYDNAGGNYYAITNLIPDNDDDGGYPNDNDPSDDDPNKPSGGDGAGDKSSDEILDDITPTLNVTGIITMYKLTTALLNELGKDLWSDNFMKTILKITQSPIDSVIGVKLYNFSIPSGTLKTVYLGNYKSNITAPTIENSIVVLNMGSIRINEFFGDFKDYNPYTKISIYLPFIGVVDLNTNEVMNSLLSLNYKVNILTGNCIALITVTKQIDETNLNSVLYQFNGTCDIELPLSAASANTMIYGRLSQMQSIATAVNRIGHNYKDGFSESNVQNGINATANVLKNEIDANHLDVTRTGNLTGSNGSLGILIPYIIIERVIPNYPTIYAKNLGLPIDRALKLNNLSGYTEIESILISNFTGLQSEYEELQSILKSGVIF